MPVDCWIAVFARQLGIVWMVEMMLLRVLAARSARAKHETRSSRTSSQNFPKKHNFVALVGAENRLTAPLSHKTIADATSTADAACSDHRRSRHQ